METVDFVVVGCGPAGATAAREAAVAPEGLALGSWERGLMRDACEVAGRFSRRLSHRVKSMRFLERVPARYGVLFEQLASTPRFADLLQKEDCERTMGDRMYLYGQALRFAVRAAGFAGR